MKYWDEKKKRLLTQEEKNAVEITEKSSSEKEHFSEEKDAGRKAKK